MEELVSEKKIQNSTRLSTTGKILLGLTGGAGVALTVLCVPFVSPAFRRFCLPYVPATNQQVRNVLDCLKNRSGRLLDVGSGDGRIVIEAAKNGFESHGVELNRVLIQYSRVSALRNGVYPKTKFIRKDLWKLDFKPYNNIVIFGVEQMMVHFEKKVLREACDDAVIIACRFPLPNLQPCFVTGDGVDAVWTYNVSKRRKLQ